MFFVSTLLHSKLITKPVNDIYTHKQRWWRRVLQVRHAQGVHNVAGEKDHSALMKPDFFDASITPLGWNQVIISCSSLLFFSPPWQRHSCSIESCEPILGPVWLNIFMCKYICWVAGSLFSYQNIRQLFPCDIISVQIPWDLPKLTCRSTAYENMWRNLDLQKRLSWLFVLLCWGTLVYTPFFCVCVCPA
jgi:hypothetical protein